MVAPAIENPYVRAAIWSWADAQEERQSLLLERIIKNVDLLNEALQELNRSVAEINNRNQETTIVSEMWNGYRRNVDFNLQNIDADAHASAP